MVNNDLACKLTRIQGLAMATLNAALRLLPGAFNTDTGKITQTADIRFQIAIRPDT